jgi:hypothetical protein
MNARSIHRRPCRPTAGRLAVVIAAIAVSALWPVPPAAADGPLVRYANDFQSAEVGSVPDDFLVLQGAFSVQEQDGHRFLELPGAPLESFGLLFGPTERANLAVSARVQTGARGRLYSTFGIGLNGVAGYRLQVSPARQALELYKADEPLAATPFNWRPDSWTMMRLRVRQLADDKWKVEGKAWEQGADEPAGWMIVLEDADSPPPGRPSLWASPFAGKPIRFDDLLVTEATGD